jgi:hypothetical protein
MRHRVKPLSIIGLLMLADYVLLGWAAAASLTGIVMDLGAESPAHNGISGVWIVVKDVKEKQVGSGLTDAQGAYNVDLSISANRLTAFYEKLGFQPRPIIREITDIKNEQKPVFMLKEGATDQYYRIVAIRLGEELLPEEQIREGTAIVAALPQTEKSRVKDHLKKQGAVKVLRNIEIAELGIKKEWGRFENRLAWSRSAEMEARIAQQEKELSKLEIENRQSVLLSERRRLLLDIDDKQVSLNDLNAGLERLRRENARLRSDSEDQQREKQRVDLEIQKFQAEISRLDRDNSLSDKVKKERIASLTKQIKNYLVIMLTR